LPLPSSPKLNLKSNTTKKKEELNLKSNTTLNFRKSGGVGD
jgi:hypothetical protein